MRKRKRSEDSEDPDNPKSHNDSKGHDDSEDQDDRHHYDILWEEIPLSSDTSDDGFLQTTPGAQQISEENDDEDITGEIPFPEGFDQFAGPGTFSSELFCDPSNHIQINGRDLNMLLMTYRRTHVIKLQATTEHEQL